MGQQQETMAGSALRRIILVLAVAAVMAALVAVMAAPAFATPKHSVTCADQPTGDPDFGKGRSFHTGFHPCGPNGFPG